MVQYITRKKSINILLLLSVISTSFTTIYKVFDKGTFVTEVSLKNGESVLLKDAFDMRTVSPIIQEKSHNLQNSAIIRSQNVNSLNITFIDKYINRIQRGRYLGYWNILDFPDARITDPFYVKEIGNFDLEDEFKVYYHSLFQNKACRKLMFYAALDVVEKMSRNLPNDFVKGVLIQLDELIELTEISTYYRTDFSDNKNYWKGFIHRRVEANNVPLSEINSYLVEAKNKLSRIDQSKLDDALYEIRINNEIQILLNSKGYLVMKNRKKFSYSNIKSVKYLKDDSGGYYLIVGKDFRDLYDDELNKVN